jgi:hypothetical protein
MEGENAVYPIAERGFVLGEEKEGRRRIYYLPSDLRATNLDFPNVNITMKKSVLFLITALIGIAFITSCAEKQGTTATSTTAAATTKPSRSPSPAPKKKASTKKKAPATEASPSESASPAPTP